jgi:hypothetical protein
MESDVQGACQHGDLRPGQGKVQSGRRPAATLRWTDCGVDSSAARSPLGPAHSQPRAEPYAVTDTYSQPHAESDTVAGSYSESHAEPYAVAERHSQPNAEPNAVAGTYSQPHAEPDAVADSYSQPRADAVARAYYQPHAEPYAVAGTYSQPHALAAADSQPVVRDSHDLSMSDSALPSQGDRRRFLLD